MPTMTIARLAEAGGVGVETVRYYQRRGLIDEPPRPGGGRVGRVRRYGPEDARKLRFIRSAQGAGFTLEEIGELLRLDATDDRHRAHHMAEARIAALDAKVAELQHARARLARLAAACHDGGDGPCPILLAFDGDAPAEG